MQNNEIRTLLSIAATVVPDEIDCDQCLAGMSEYADVETVIAEDLKGFAAVRSHLENCVCCREEYLALQAALRSLDTSGGN